MKMQRMLSCGPYLVAVLLSQLFRAPSSHATQLVPGMFMMGDSQLDVGTNSYIAGCDVTANFGPYGESYFNPPTGRFSDGLLIPDLFAQQLGLPSFPPPYIQPGASFSNGVNFASAGSGLLPTTRASDRIISIDQQVQQFLSVKPQLESQYGSSLINQSIYLISGGGNDLGVYLATPTTSTTTPLPMFVSQLVQKLEDTVTTLYYAGARKVVLLLLAPLGCLPFVRASVATGPLSEIPGCVDFVNLAILAFNAEAEGFVTDMRATFTDLNLVYVDPYDKVEGYINAGESNGFTQGSVACCGSGPYNGAVQCGTKDRLGNHLTTVCSRETMPTYVFFDNFHPTEIVYTLLVNSAYDGGNQSISHPIDVKTLAYL